MMFGLSHFWPQLQLQNQAIQRAAFQANLGAKIAQNSLKSKLPAPKSPSVSSDEDSKSACDIISIPNSTSSEPSK